MIFTHGPCLVGPIHNWEAAKSNGKWSINNSTILTNTTNSVYRAYASTEKPEATDGEYQRGCVIMLLMNEEGASDTQSRERSVLQPPAVLCSNYQCLECNGSMFSHSSRGRTQGHRYLPPFPPTTFTPAQLMIRFCLWLSSHCNRNDDSPSCYRLVAGLSASQGVIFVR